MSFFNRDPEEIAESQRWEAEEIIRESDCAEATLLRLVPTDSGFVPGESCDRSGRGHRRPARGK